jgi:hypothetical protein
VLLERLLVRRVERVECVESDELVVVYRRYGATSSAPERFADITGSLSEARGAS